MPRFGLPQVSDQIVDITSHTVIDVSGLTDAPDDMPTSDALQR